MTQGLWLVQSPKKVLGAIENTSYYEKNRFDNMRTKVQGELRAKKSPQKTDKSVQFNKAMDRQRSNTSSRLRNDIGAVFVAHLHPRVGDALDIQDMALRAGYADLIGGRKDDSGKITFHPFDAPALHSDGADRLNVETFLKNKLVMHVAAAVIYGKKKPIKMATNKPCVSGPRCMQQMHNISNSTPGFVACAGALTLWALSMDVELKKKGQQTGINWYSCYESYLRYLLEGLRNRSKPVLALFREWDAELFPDSESLSAQYCDFGQFWPFLLVFPTLKSIYSISALHTHFCIIQSARPVYDSRHNFISSRNFGQNSFEI
ncbi:hypothetical protein R3P38DRAFT_2648234 [Favolaschia claudopus]|uniref:Uncharacterized protein n=1 Tax=Favolaschia claudopus TaxID=2862362 RepID=A0AAW0A7Z2_9AGAR